ncbi:MAG: thiamine-phosphate pyrophosphorylase [Candidatus Omnitrophica bacterium]|nr:thiamine-phosphate pyrophosphorylase [Candidatus Omnitrophota bacterium]
MKINKQKILRVLDANFNRAKEGLRVCEDICRFWLNDVKLSKGYKDIRHKLTEAINTLELKALIASRDIEGDVGKGSSLSEKDRKGLSDIFFANSQRVKESTRVLEEFAKLLDKDISGRIKEVRYGAYDLEKKIAGRL